MGTPPEEQHTEIRGRLRKLATEQASVAIMSDELITLLDYIAELERENYDGWECSMGDDL